ncbi:MAG: transglutaminase family protein [Verrucomicrobia bacterium]|jgi:transglutaminase-like putative cysteine protease|nr:transglutaminase family protein [Verrucomicrobiota bacterium]
MKFSIRHTTAYQYSEPVWDSFNDAHLCPVSDDYQNCLSFDLEITPPSSAVMRRLDFYTNQVHHFEVMEPHDSLTVSARSVVETFADTRDLSVSVPLAGLSGLECDERYYDFLSNSPRVALGPMWTHEADAIVSRIEEDVRLRAEAIMGFIYEQFSYVSGSTHVASKIEDVFPQRRGVCQDFAHIMIALCRAVGIPARYVSGYFYAERPARASANDSTVSHAWVECFLPGIGWLAYDPTHNRRAGMTYIELARGRDYADVRPLAGTYRGAAEVEMTVSVAVERVG